MRLRDVREELEDLGNTVRELVEDVDVMHSELADAVRDGFTAVLERLGDVGVDSPSAAENAENGGPDDVATKALALRVSALELASAGTEVRLSKVESRLDSVEECFDHRMKEIAAGNTSVQEVAKRYKDKLEHVVLALDSLSHRFEDLDAKLAKLACDVATREAISRSLNR